MKKKLPILGALAGLAVLLALLAGGLLSADGHGDEMIVEMSITNLTRGQVMSPVFVARHDQGAGPLYVLGEAASEDLAKMAEDADASGLLESWNPEENGSVSQAMLATGAITPGATVDMEFRIDDGKNLISFASMLVSTNDAFIGASGLDVSKSGTIYLTAYDSGSEANSEDCEYVPGPPCGNHVEDESEAEGFIHVHAGIHGGEGSDLNPANRDWRNPVARLVIKTWTLSR